MLPVDLSQCFPRSHAPTTSHAISLQDMLLAQEEEEEEEGLADVTNTR